MKKLAFFTLCLCAYISSLEGNIAFVILDCTLMVLIVINNCAYIVSESSEKNKQVNNGWTDEEEDGEQSE